MNQEMETNEILLNGLKQLGMTSECENTNILKLVNKYLQEIMMFNKKFNLVGDKNQNDIMIRHILDSIAGFSVFNEIANKIGANIKIADIGSGAGLPGIPLAILFKSTGTLAKITLIERMKKRCTFLQNVKAVLNLKNIEILESDVKDVKTNFDIITCRALTTLTSEIFYYLNKLKSQDGKIILYKGNIKKTEDELKQISEELKIPINYRIQPLKTPFLDAQRCLVII